MTSDLFYEQLNSDRPICLFLGQSYRTIDGGEDTFLHSAINKFGGNTNSEEDQTYQFLLDSTASESPNDSYSWLSNLSLRQSATESLEQIAEYPWNAIYTSAIDSFFSRLFRKDWRNIEPIYTESQNPNDPRSKSKLYITYLFGRIDQTDADLKCPLDRIRFSVRKNTATIFLERLPEIVTSLGSLVIEGYNPSGDWLNFEQFYGPLSKFQEKQIFWFSCPDIWPTETKLFIDALKKENKVVFFKESLSSVLSRGKNKGFISTDQYLEKEILGKQISISQKAVALPRHIISKVRNSAAIISKNLFDDIKLISDDERYRKFKIFLRDGYSGAIWEAYSRNFAFRRYFQDELEEKTLKAIEEERKGKGDGVVILHGQTGSGKSIALGMLAFELFKRKDYPILFIDRQPIPPNLTDLDVFCNWAEEEGADSTIIIWDGTFSNPEQYQTLYKSLSSSRGRKIVIVGSCYKQDRIVKNSNAIEAPILLTDQEAKDLQKHFQNLDPEISSFIDVQKLKNEDIFLVALYRYFPETRTQISIGLHNEAENVEKILNNRGSRKISEVADTVLGNALMVAKGFSDKFLLKDECCIIDNEEMNSAQQMIAMIMTTGMLGVKVPIEIIMRIFSSPGMQNLEMLFADIDLFRWEKDYRENIFILPRHPLEAKIISKGKLGGAKGEIDCVRELLRNIKGKIGFDSVESLFAADLVRAIGPNGPMHDRYSNFYLSVANDLKELREDRNINETYLILQEVALIREYIKSMEKFGSPLKNSMDLLDNAIELLNSAIDDIDTTHGRSKRHYANLLVELSSLYGTSAVQALKNNASTNDVLFRYRHCFDTATLARSVTPDNFYPIDVMLWSARDMLQNSSLKEQDRLEIKANYYDCIDSVDIESLDLNDQFRFFEKRLQTSSVLKDIKMSNESFEVLKKIGSSAGYVIKAHNIVGDLSNEISIDDNFMERANKAFQFLKKEYSNFSNDPRCMNLYFKLWWIINTKVLLLFGERQAIPLSENLLSEGLALLNSLAKAEGSSIKPRTLYLLAVFNWQMKQYSLATDIWRKLQSETDFVSGKRRLLKSLISTDHLGNPILYNGQIHSINPGRNRALVFVEELRQQISIFLSEFGMNEPKRGEAVEPFYISFNYIGPRADPTRFFRKR